MKKIAMTVAFVAVMIGLSACDNTGSAGDSESTTVDTDSGIGMTYGGKTGIDIGGGLILPFDGSGPSLGFGF